MTGTLPLPGQPGGMFKTLAEINEYKLVKITYSFFLYLAFLTLFGSNLFLQIS